MKKTNTGAITVIAIVLYLCSAIMAYKGYDKMTNYYNSENYYSLNQNAYVGGDAYNYIINGTYATSFFVLSMGFFLGGTIMVGTGIISKAVCESDEVIKDTIVKELGAIRASMVNIPSIDAQVPDAIEKLETPVEES